MDTFQRVKRWLATSLEISEQIITPESTLGDLYRSRPRTTPLEDDGEPPGRRADGESPDSLDAIELIMLFEEEFVLEFPELDADALMQMWLDATITVQQVVDLVDGNMKG